MPQKLWALLCLGAAGAVTVAVATQFIHASNQSVTFSAINFFSYFTILSNIFIALVLIASAVATLRGKKPSLNLECTRGATTVYMLTTGIVYALLLSQYPLGLTLSWVNTILHQIIPIFAILDWLLAPPRVRIPPMWWWSWLLFPLLYLAYTLLRGPQVNWYPYPFFNPDLHGYGQVAVYCAGITVGMTAMIMLVGWVGNALGSKKAGKK